MANLPKSPFKCPNKRCGQLLDFEDPIQAATYTGLWAVVSASRSLRLYCSNPKCSYKRKGYRYKLNSDGKVVKDSVYNIFLSRN